MPNQVIKTYSDAPQRDPRDLAAALAQQQFKETKAPNLSAGGGGDAASMNTFKDLVKADPRDKDPMNLATPSDVADREEGIAMGSGYSPMKVGQNIGNTSMFNRLMDRYGGLFSGGGN